jgi:hypothetical protein
MTSKSKGRAAMTAEADQINLECRAEETTMPPALEDDIEWSRRERHCAPPMAPAPDAWPVLANAAYQGLAGEFVREVEPHTEADPISLLLQYLIFFGNAVGRGPHYMVESDRHCAHLNVVLVGQTGKARKGTSANRVLHIFRLADADWEADRVMGGLSSGEGLIKEVRDPDGVDPGTDDKRLLILEPELAGALTAMRRPGNILSRVVREAWDGTTLRTLVKNAPLRATGPHISIVGHITAEELRARLDSVSMANGLANRFLFACVRRARLLPNGGDLKEEVVQELARRTQEALVKARQILRVTMTEAADDAWARGYETLSADRPGLLGAILGRGEAQTIRLALAYALIDGSGQIDVEHLDAALAVWRYCEASAGQIFGGIIGDRVEAVLLSALRRAGPNGMTRTQIRDLLGRHHQKGEIDRALAMLHLAGTAARVPSEANGGRPAELWMAIGE